MRNQPRNVAVKGGHGRIALFVSDEQNVLADVPQLSEVVPRGQVLLEQLGVVLHAGGDLLLDLELVLVAANVQVDGRLVLGEQVALRLGDVRDGVGEMTLADRVDQVSDLIERRTEVDAILGDEHGLVRAVLRRHRLLVRLEYHLQLE